MHTVSSLVNEVARGLKATHGRVSVSGEIGEWKKYGSGHAYAVLKDPEAQLSFVMFRGDNSSLAFEPKQGLQVVVHGGLDLYPKNGKFQMIARSMSLVGQGEQNLAAKQLREKLEAEGLFEDKFKVPIPSYVTDVAVVTSPKGAVIHDILTVIDRRIGGLKLTIYPASMQGSEAVSEIVAALAGADAGQHDVIILARGGGSKDDLAAFNSEAGARAVAGVTTPLISAVGHETDFSVSDDVADLRAATPSQAAEIVSQGIIDARLGSMDLHSKLEDVRTSVNLERRTLEMLAATIAHSDPMHLYKMGWASVFGVSSAAGTSFDQPLAIKFWDGIVHATVTGGKLNA